MTQRREAGATTKPTKKRVGRSVFEGREARGALLAVDAGINLALGALLLLVPAWTAEFFGLPKPGTFFYVRVLGGVLLGIGIALLLERSQRQSSGLGLGLGGAVAINLCGGLAVAFWMAAKGADLPLRGQITLWSLVALLVVLSGLEGLRAVRRTE